MEKRAYTLLKDAGKNVWTTLPDAVHDHPITRIELANQSRLNRFFNIYSLSFTTYASDKSLALAESNSITKILEEMIAEPDITESVLTDKQYAYQDNPRRHVYMATVQITARSDG